MLFEAADQQPEIALERIISGLSAMKNGSWNTYGVSDLTQRKDGLIYHSCCISSLIPNAL